MLKIITKPGFLKKEFADWKKTAIPEVNIPEVKNVAQTEIDFVDMPNAVQSEIALVNTINLQKNQEDYFPVMVANKILGGGGEARLEPETTNTQQLS